METKTPLPTVSQHLETLLASNSHLALRTSVIPTLLNAIAAIASSLRAAHHVSLAGTSNAFGDDQLNVDVAAENILRAALSTCPSVRAVSSEEDPVERPNQITGTQPQPQAPSPPAPSSQEEYAIAFDPLDGSSIIAPNWTVGTIIGIWDKASALHALPAVRQVAAILGVYGPRTTAIVAIRVPDADPACFEVGFSDTKDVTMIRTKVHLAEPEHYHGPRYFAPANLRAAAESERYMGLIARFVENRYTLRYSGGLVPDVVHALVKGHGIYVSPVTERSGAKLRKLYELCPIALVVECAGGMAIDPKDGEEILEKPVLHTDERAGLVCGTTEDVELVRSFFF
jgi:sedoheptulose-bisphosphatase